MPAMSPRTQQLQAGMTAGPDQEVALFEQGFSEMAYNLLSSRMPDVMQDVITFKVLDVDIDQGTGTGAFILLRHGTPIYIPVVMCDNAIKPLELFYHKSTNVFLPLTKGWLDETDKNALSALGGGVKTPETLYTDVDIRNVVVPPITGRFSYAAWVPKAIVDVARVCSRHALEAAEKIAGEGRPLVFLNILAEAPNRAKLAFAAMLERNTNVMLAASSTYGVSKIAAALRPRVEKIAAKQLTGGALWIADKDTTPSEFRRVFGDKAGEAYAGVKLKGFAARDTREARSRAVQEQPFAQWTEPTRPGVYTVYETGGKETPAFVMPMPVDIFRESPKYGRKPAVPAHVPPADRVYPSGRPSDNEFRLRPVHDKFLVVFGNGSYAMTGNLVGSPSIADELAGPLHKRMFVDVDGSPRTGKGFFVRQQGTTFEATVPMEIKSITTGDDGVRRMQVTGSEFDFHKKTVVTDPNNAFGSLSMPKGSDIVYVPSDFIWVPLKERREANQLYTSALDLQACVSNALGSVGAKKVSIKDAGARQFSINGRRALDRVSAIKKLAYELCLSVDDADALLEKAASDHQTSAWIVSGPQLARAQMKLAGDDDKSGDKKKSDSDKPKKKSPPPGGDAGGDGGGDPGMEDPGLGQEAAMAAMAPPAPPPPQPLDLAAMEMDQAIQHEMQKLVEKQQTIQMLLQRSSEIAGGAPPAPTVQTQAMGAPPSSQNLATGGPGMPPGMTAGMGGGMGGAPQGGMDPMAGGMDPSMGSPVPQNTMDPMAGGMDPSMGPPIDPSMGGAPPPGMDPSMGGGMQPGMQPGMDPSMGGGMPPGMGGGMDPSMGGGMGAPPPGAMMPPDGPNAQSLGNEINPQFLEQAAQLHSADMFDAAAVATLAQSPALHGVVAQYLPNLEKAVDNLGRVMLTLWMQAHELKPQIGETTFTGLEENIQSTFKGMGDLVLRLSRGVQAIKEPDDHAA